MGDREVRLASFRVKRVLRRSGLLPITDSQVPSLVSIVAGAPVSGSWWGHPAGQLIYQVGEALESDPELLVVRLWGGKRTLVHRRLWPALARIGRARAAWQMAGLDDLALQLLQRIERENTGWTDRLPVDFPGGSKEFRSALHDLDDRLLILTRSVHTSSGAHALEVESWAVWSSSTRTPRFSDSVASAESALEEAALRLAPGVMPHRVFPWARSKSAANPSNR